MIIDHHIILIVTCFIGGLASSSIGTSGGFTFAVMASVFPAGVVVPIHALVETTGSVFRAVLLRDYIKWPFLAVFLLGGAGGILLAVPFINALPEEILQLILGFSILAVTWLPFSQVLANHANYASIGGGVTSFLTLFIGATGPLVAALLSKRFDDHPEVIATHAACMSAQHAAKIVVFTLAGWTIATFASEVVSMVLATAIGTWLGRYVILTGPQDLIKNVFKVAVSLLGIRLMIDAVIKILGN